MDFLNRIEFALTAAPGLAGDLAVGAAQANRRTLGAGHDGMILGGVEIEESGVGWEIRNGCTYTDATGTLTRGSLEDSSSGGAVDFSAAAVVRIGASALLAGRFALAMASVIPGGRLTLESGEPVSRTDQVAKTSLFYTPYIHDVCPLWDGNSWVPVEFQEKAIALSSLSVDTPYDVFAFLNAGALELQLLAWSSDNARATAATYQDGRLCKSGDKTRLLIGSIYTTGATTTEDSENNRFVGNVYNRVRRRGRGSSAAAHTYTGGAFREWNGGASVTRSRWIDPIGGRSVPAHMSAVMSGTYAKGHVTINGNGSRFGTYYLSLATGGATDLRVFTVGAANAIDGLNYATCDQYGSSGTTYSSFLMDTFPEI